MKVQNFLCGATTNKIDYFFPSASVGQHSGHFARSPKEVCHITSLLVSSKLTQNSDLLSLLKWRSNPDPVNVAEALTRVLRIPGEELVKFLEDILDALFSLFANADGSISSQSGHVFRVLVHIFSLLEETKFTQFVNILNVYIESQFSAPLIYKGLIIWLQNYCDYAPFPDKRDIVYKGFRELPWIMKLLIQSRILYARATGHAEESEVFKNEICAVFNAFNRVLSLDTKGKFYLIILVSSLVFQICYFQT